MGKSHFKSDIIGLESNVIASFASITASAVTVGATLSAATISGTTSASAPSIYASTKVKAGSYFQMGDHQYIFFGRCPSAEANIVAMATNLSNDASVKGSLFANYNATKGNLWYLVSDTTASIVGGVAA